MTATPRIRMTWGWETSGIEADIGGLRHVATVRRESASTAALASVTCEAAAFPYGEPGPVPLHQLIGKLSRPGDGRAEALDALASLLPPGTVGLALAGPAALSLHESFYLGDRAAGAARRAFATAHPSLSLLLPSILDRTRLHGARELPDGPALLSAYAPHASRTSVARVLASDALLLRQESLDALLAIPHDWFPSPGPEREAFDRLAVAAQPLVEALGDHRILASSRGRWAEFEGRVTATLRANPQGGREPGGACRAAIDAATAFSGEAMTPALMAGGAIDWDSLLALGTGGPGKPPHGIPPSRVAARLLYGGKSLPAILETSARWHARQHAIRAELAAVAARFGGFPQGHDAWPVPFPPVTAPNGVEVRFLANRGELVAEGTAGMGDGAPGLAHCVGGYSDRCMDGSIAVASLRVPHDGGFRRLSTASMAVAANAITPGQHSGRRNGPPPPEAVTALAWFRREVAAGRLVPSPGYLAADWRRRHKPLSLRDLCGYDAASPEAAASALAAWAPLLPRPLRDVGGLAGAARPHLPDGAPPSRGVLARVRDVPARAVLAAMGCLVGVAAAALWSAGMLEATATCAGIVVLGVLPALLFLGGALALSEGSTLLGLALKATALVAFLTAFKTGLQFPEHRRLLNGVMGAQAVVMVLPYAWLGLTVAWSAHVTARSWLRAARYNARRRGGEGSRPPGTALAGDVR